MGTDIHMFVEKRDGDWQAVSGPNPFYGEWSKEEKSLEGWLYWNRHYDLFAILADVRNGYGFAGCDTGDGFIPVAMPKGLPDDVSPEVKKEAEGWGEDAHNHSWLTLRELLEYDWNKDTKQRGIVSEEEYVVFKKEGKPKSWCGGVSGQSIVHISNEEMDDILNGRKIKEEGKSYYTRIEWGESYEDAVGEAKNQIISGLEELGSPDDVRIVFWFDS